MTAEHSGRPTLKLIREWGCRPIATLADATARVALTVGAGWVLVFVSVTTASGILAGSACLALAGVYVGLVRRLPRVSNGILEALKGALLTGLFAYFIFAMDWGKRMEGLDLACIYWAALVAILAGEIQMKRRRRLEPPLGTVTAAPSSKKPEKEPR